MKQKKKHADRDQIGTNQMVTREVGPTPHARNSPAYHFAEPRSWTHGTRSRRVEPKITMIVHMR